jgi:hypothetical protein
MTDDRRKRVQIAGAMSSAPSIFPVPAHAEAAVWAEVSGNWVPLYGSFAELGISVEWHDFHSERDLDWARSFHPGSVEVCLNFGGQAWLADGAAERELPPGHMAIYTTRVNAPKAVRRAGSLHRFLTIEVTPKYLSTQCAGQLDLLKSPLRRFVNEGAECAPFLEIAPLSTALLSVRAAFVEPVVPQAARAAWYQAKVLEARMSRANFFVRCITGGIANASSGHVIFWSATWKTRLPWKCSPRMWNAAPFTSAASLPRRQG